MCTLYVGSGRSAQSVSHRCSQRCLAHITPHETTKQENCDILEVVTYTCCTFRTSKTLALMYRTREKQAYGRDITPTLSQA